MAKVFDATTKHLIEAHPVDWLKFAGLPLGRSLSVVDADLSSFSLAADKVIRVEGPEPYFAHVELESAAHRNRDRHMLMYNSVLGCRHGLPVRSVLILLRSEAHSPAVVGRVKDFAGSEHSLDFRYKIIRLWEQSPEALLAGGPGTLPLAPISAVPPDRVADVARQMEQRLHESAPADATELETAAYILMGLRYSRSFIEKILKGARQMKESVTYQAILEEGEREGKPKAYQAFLIRLATSKFGPPNGRILSRLGRITDEDTLVALGEKISIASSWADLLKGS